MLRKVTFGEFLGFMRESRERVFGRDAEVERSVREVLRDVRERGDEALIDYTLRFDGIALERGKLRVTCEEMDSAHQESQRSASSFLRSFREACENVRSFHAAQVPRPWLEVNRGFVRGWVVRPVRRAGVYAPGGKAAYPSSLLMGVVPAQLAGVKELIVCTPPGKGGEASPLVLAACRELGVTSVYRVGGAQAVAAMACGTETVPRVDVIVGPGNRYVTAAKRLLYGSVGIDLLAGPSEVAIIADSTARPEWVAMDLIAQAEHDEDARVLLVSPDEGLIDDSLREIVRLVGSAVRRDVVTASLRDNGFAVLVRDLDEALSLVNEWAPEHLQLYVREPLELLDGVENTGAVFLGPYGVVPFGDYWAGPNHILPTGGSGRYMSGVGVETFVRRMSFLLPLREGFTRGAEPVISLAEQEGLFGHAEAVRVRLRAFEEGPQEDWGDGSGA